jgi:hypothetical protein
VRAGLERVSLERVNSLLRKVTPKILNGQVDLFGAFAGVKFEGSVALEQASSGFAAVLPLDLVLVSFDDEFPPAA